MSPIPLLAARALRPSGAEHAQPLDLELSAGMFCLVGPQQDRLSLYMRALAGVDASAGGELKLLGRPLAGPRSRDWQLLRRRVGFASPQAPLLSVLNGLRNVMLPALYHRLAPEVAVQARAEALLKEVSYEADHLCLPAYMSRLQRHHLLLARALILEPRILLADRPFDGLDTDDCAPLRDYLAGPVRKRTKLLLVAANDALLAQKADGVLFVGEQWVHLFDSWRALLGAQQDEVRRFVESERQRCAALE